MKLGEVGVGRVEDFVDDLAEFLVAGPLGELTPKRVREKEELKKHFLKKRDLFKSIYERWRRQLLPLL